MSRGPAPLTGSLRVGSLLALLALPLLASTAPASSCDDCARWNQDQAPFRIYGNTYYVGVHGLSAVLVTSPQGHVLIDGDLEESVPKIVAHVRALGFRVEDIRWIVNSHVHFDHAGGIAALQQLSGARVAATAPAAAVLEAGASSASDPQFGLQREIPKVAGVRVVADGERLQVGPLELTAHWTAGHTPGGTTWSWRSCEATRCLDIVYADSLSPVAAPGFRFTNNHTYPQALADFEHSFEVLEALPCDILLTPHPDASDLWERVARHKRGGERDALVDPSACRRYAQGARERLDARKREERGTATGDHRAGGSGRRP